MIYRTVSCCSFRIVWYGYRNISSPVYLFDIEIQLSPTHHVCSSFVKDISFELSTKEIVIRLFIASDILFTSPYRTKPCPTLPCRTQPRPTEPFHICHHFMTVIYYHLFCSFTYTSNPIAIEEVINPLLYSLNFFSS